MLDLVAGDCSADICGLGIDGWGLRSVDVDNLCDLAKVHLDIEGIGLLRNQLEIIEHFLLKPCSLNGQTEVIRRQGVEIEDAGIAARSDHSLVGGQILESEGGSRNHLSLRVSDNTLNRGAVLRNCS